MDKPGGFVGLDALRDGRRARPPTRRQVHVLLEDPRTVLYHGESILLGDEIVGVVTSGAHGYTLGAAVGLGYVSGEAFDAAGEPAGEGRGSRFRVDAAGALVPATVSAAPFYDPANDRLRA
jgi:4-methylaminobutanoate oxidase (formaldehyde-forming)